MSPSAPLPDGDPASGAAVGEVPPSTDVLVDPPDVLPAATRRRLWLLGTDTGTWRLRVVIVVLGVLGFLAFIAVGANRPADPMLAPEGPRTPPPGFGETGFSITTAEGVTSSGCAVLAAAEPQWAEGFMHKRAIPGYDAMVFDFPDVRDGAFFNRNVPITLDIAWFDDTGAYVDAERMPPCEDIDSCPLYRPQAPYRRAVETPVGGLTRLGVAAGARLELSGPCTGG